MITIGLHTNMQDDMVPKLAHGTNNHKSTNKSQLQSDLVHVQVHVGLNGGALCDSKDACLERCDRDHDGVSFLSW